MILKRWFIVFICFVLFLGAYWFIGHGSNSKAKTILDRSSVIVAYGDSLTYGYGVNPDDAYPAVLSELTGRPIINEGVNGRTTAEGLADLPAMIQRHHPDLVILFLGGNDFLRGQPVADTKAHITAMVQQLKAQSIQVLLVATPNFQSLGVPALYADIASSEGVWLEDKAVVPLMINPKMKSDRVHFNEEGYRRLAEAIAHRLAAVGLLAPIKG